MVRTFSMPRFSTSVLGLNPDGGEISYSYWSRHIIVLLVIFHSIFLIVISIYKFVSYIMVLG